MTGWLLLPMVTTAAMNLHFASVIFNTLRLRHAKVEPRRGARHKPGCLLAPIAKKIVTWPVECPSPQWHRLIFRR